MKRHLSVLACLVLVLTFVFSLASCDVVNKLLGKTPEHTHSYVDGKCECGEPDPDYVAPHKHNFVDGTCECGATDPDYKPDDGDDGDDGDTPVGPTTDGTIANPHALTVPGTLAVDFAGGIDPVWYVFTAAESKTLKVTLGSANACMGYGLDTEHVTYTPQGMTSVKVDLEAGTKYYVAFCSHDEAAAQYTVTAEYVVSPYEVVIHEGKGNVVTFSAAEIEAGTAQRKLVIENNSSYKFTGSIHVQSIVDADNVAATYDSATYSYALAAGEYTVTFDMFSVLLNVADTGYDLFVDDLNVPNEEDNPSVPAGPLDTDASELVIGPNTITVAADDIDAGAIEYTIVVTAAGTFTASSNDLGARFTNANNEIVGFGQVYLQPGTYTVAVLCASVETAGDYTLTLSYEAPSADEDEEGTQDNPIVIETLPTTITLAGEFDKYYSFTATEDCSVIVAHNGEGYLSLDVSSNGSAFLKAGETVVINLWAYGEADDSFVYEITLGEYAEEGEQSRPITFSQDNSFTCAYPGGNDVDKFVWYRANIYNSGYFVITFTDRVNAKVGTNLDNLVAITDATTKVEVASGDTLYLAIQSFDLAEAEITFETAWEWAPGTSDNPYDAVNGDNSADIPAGSDGVYFNYTPAANGTITVNFSNITFNYYSSETYWWAEATNGATFDVIAGVDFRIQIYGWAEDATNVSFNIAFEEKAAAEITGDLVRTETIVTPGNYATSTEVEYTATGEGYYTFNVIGKDPSTWFQMYDAADDSWPQYTDFPFIVEAAEGDVIKFRLYGWSDDESIVGTEVTVEIYYEAAEIGGDDEGGSATTEGTEEDPIVLNGAGNYTAEVAASGSVCYTYTNSSDAAVSFLLSIEGSNYYVSYGMYGFALLDNTLSYGAPNPTNVIVPAGATLYIKVETYNMAADTINFSLTTEGGEESNGTGERNDPYIISESGEYTAEVAAEGEVCYTYTNSGNSAVNVTLHFQGSNYYVNYGTHNFLLLDQMLTPGAPVPTVTIAVGSTLYLSVATNDMAADTINFTVTIETSSDSGNGAGAANALVLGENAVGVTVTNYYADATTVTFTATEAGTYILSAAEGETNADVYITMGDWCELPYTFTLDAGDTISFDVCSADFMSVTEDTINLVITKA